MGLRPPEPPLINHVECGRCLRGQTAAFWPPASRCGRFFLSAPAFYQRLTVYLTFFWPNFSAIDNVSYQSKDLREEAGFLGEILWLF